MQTNLIICCVAMLAFITCCNQSRQDSKLDTPASIVDPLPSWNDGAVKEAIIAYVKSVTDSSSSDFIPEADRIATFDNDGTLWAEKPYVQELFAFFRVDEIVKQTPELAKKQPFKAVVEHDRNYFTKGGEKALLELVTATHTGLTEDEFEMSVHNFFANATYPTRNTPIKSITYQPQIELLHYLRANGFKTFIVTGGTIEVVRGISQEFYGIPKDQVVGTTFKYKFIPATGKVVRESDIVLFNDKEAKPVSIQQHIGQRPVFACGNEGGAGDIAMLQYCQSNRYRSCQLLINHDDSTREFFYSEKDSASLKAAAKNKWHVVSMKDDWEQIFTSSGTSAK